VGIGVVAQRSGRTGVDLSITIGVLLRILFFVVRNFSTACAFEKRMRAMRFGFLMRAVHDRSVHCPR